jgi:3-dehydroquinate dehydratase/shikimate dehydrogenase
LGANLGPVFFVERFFSGGNKRELTLSARVCVPIRESSTEKAVAAIEKARAWADLVEIRADYITDLDVSALLRQKPCPILFTLRARTEGGEYSGAELNRLETIIQAARAGADWVDVEFSAYWQGVLASVPKDRVVLSYHNFEETPDSLELLAEKMSATGAGVIKIATRARCLTDNIRIYRLLRRAADRKIQMCALAMGRPGMPSRILGLFWGSWMTFASIPGGEGTAEGQIPADELGNLYRIHQIGSETEFYGILGNPLDHLFSPQVHNAAFAAREKNALFMPLEASGIEDFLEFNKTVAIRGVSVAIPFKSEFCSRACSLSVEANQIGVVNTLIHQEQGWHGENTDVEGFLKPLRKRTHIARKRAVVLGAGGAARAVVFGLISQGASVCVVARDPAKARHLASDFNAEHDTWDRLEKTRWDLLVNATPVGMHPESGQSPIPKEWLTGEWVYDLVYQPPETQLLADAKQRGCKTIPGTEMFIAQAMKQQQLWCGSPGAEDVMREILFSALGMKAVERTEL